MKIRLFNSIKRNPSRNINYNQPIKNISIINNNIITKKQLTVGEKLVRMSELLNRILCRIEEKDKVLLEQLKRLSGK